MKRSCPDYNTLCEALSPLVTEAWKPQLNNLALFVYGLLMTGHVHLPKIALSLPMECDLRYVTQRLERFLKNKAIQPPLWYQGVAKAVLAAWKGLEIELILGQTDVDDRFFLLFVAVAYRKRAIPILWRLLPHKGCSGVAEQIKLLGAVAELVPPGTRIVLLADREYGSKALIEFLHGQGWFFVIRMKKDVWCQMANGRRFQIGEIPLRPGTINFEEGVCLVGLPEVRLSLNCGWSNRDPKDEPWYLLTPFRAGKDNLERYSRRFWIEEMFRDFKEQGFRLEKTHLAIGKRLEVLLLCVCIAYTWALFLGVKLQEEGRRRFTGRAKRPQLSLFQLAFRYLKRLLAMSEPFPNSSHFVNIRI